MVTHRYLVVGVLAGALLAIGLWKTPGPAGDGALAAPAESPLAVTVTLFADRDAWINEQASSQNNGADTILIVGNAGTEFRQVRRSLIRFTLPPTKPGQVVVSAQFCAFLRYSGPVATSIGIYRIVTTWTEIGVTWTNQPAVSNAAYTTLAIGTTVGQYYCWDATQMVREWHNGTYLNNGLELRSTAEATLTSYRTFDSREGAIEPYLLVTYGAPTPTPTRTRTPTVTPTSTQTPTRTPTLTPTTTPTSTPTFPPGTPSPKPETPTVTPTVTPTSTATAAPTYTPTRTPPSTRTATPTAVSGVDLSIDAIEVTQAIQDLDNSVPLVAGKRTYARAHVRSNAGSAPYVVLGRFYVVRDGVYDGPFLPDNPMARILIRPDPDRGNLNHSFYFELPPSQVEAGNIWLCLDLNFDHLVPESNYDNNWDCANVNLVTSPHVKLYIYRIKDRIGGTTYEPSWGELNALASWLRRAYPTSEVEWRFRALSFPGVLGRPNCVEVNSLLSVQRAGDAWPARWRYYGMVVDTVDFMRGCAPRPGHVGSGPTGVPGVNANPGAASSWDFDGTYGDWYGGHELGHNYGRKHVACSGGEGGPDPNYPYPNGVIGGPTGATSRYYGFDVETRAVYPGATWNDVMSYCANQWISDYTYRAIRNRLIGEGSGEAQAQAPVDGQWLAVLGRMNLTRGTATLADMYLVDSPGGAEAPSPGAYTLRLLDGQDALLARHPFTPREDSDPPAGEDVVALIDEVVPWPPATARVVVWDGKKELASRSVSANPPQVTVTHPNGGEELSGDAVTVAWTASDADGDSLSYLLRYSPDGGASWQTVATGVIEDSHAVDLAELAGSQQGLFQVWATDGVNTARDQSDGPFRVPDKRPLARIISPRDGASFLVGQQVTLVGEGYDVEEGVLPGAALSWSSDIAGTLGTGRHLVAPPLAPGRHVVTLTAADGIGQTAAQSVTFSVLAPGEAMRAYLPIISKTGP